jgi:hypothetical protein
MPKIHPIYKSRQFIYFDYIEFFSNFFIILKFLFAHEGRI